MIKKMSRIEWSAMNNREKLNHLRDNDIVIDSKRFLGNEEKYVAFCGGVLLSHWHYTEQEAMEVAVKSLSDTIQSLEMKLNE